MNNQIKKLIFIVLTLLFVILLLNIFTKGIDKNKSDITNMHILNYIPNDYELTILSNSKNNNIKKYINENISEQKLDELNMIRDSIISYLGFNFQEKIGNIYDNEFALTFFKNKFNNNEILLIFKLKKNKNINDIINIGDELNKPNQIVELKRFGKLNYISHIFQTNDNYLIASSDKKLIDHSLQSNNKHNEIFSENLMPNDINLKEIKILSILNYINPDSETKTVNKLITIITPKDNEIHLKSFSANSNKINTKILNNDIDNIKDIIFTNRYSIYKKNINFLFRDINQKDIFKEIFNELNEQLLFLTNDNNWVLCFKNELPNNISIDEFNFLKKYKREDLFINDLDYTIYTNDRLTSRENSIFYEKGNPIFSLKDELNTYISNNFSTLQNITKKITLSDEFFNNNEIKTYKYIFNDIFLIKHIDNKQLVEYYKPLKNIKYFINTELFSIENINIQINHIIPEMHEKIYLESNLKIL